MNERSAGIFLQLAFTLGIVSTQLQFPIDYPVFYRVRSTQIQVPNSNLQQDSSYSEYLSSIFTRGLTKLALDVNRLTQAVSPETAEADHIVLGPLTISGALSLVLLASIGQTFDEIRNCMGLSSIPGFIDNPIYTLQQIVKSFKRLDDDPDLDIGHQVNFANAIFLQQDFPIRPAYHEAIQTYYMGNVMNLDFLGNPENSKQVINAWVSGRTNMKIPSLLDEAPPRHTTAIIVSVLYFQALWEFPFFNGHTKMHSFYANGRANPSTSMVEMMSNGGEFPYYKDSRLGVDIMGFPYKGNRSSMYVIIPHHSNKEKLKQLENSLTPDDINHLVSSTRYAEAVVLFPKMKLESTIDLRETLEKMGIHALFDPSKANLALLSPGVTQRFNEANEAPFVSAPIPSVNNQVYKQHSQQNSESESPQENLKDRLIFTRFNEQSSCTPVFDPITNITKCQVDLSTRLSYNQRKKRASSRSIRAGNRNPLEELERIRQQVNQSPVYANPGLYADQIIHKVYVDITESGTEAAAATGISLNRSGGRVAFRADVPFLFFIYHEDTKAILFWGSVKTPSPSVNL